MLCKFLEHGNDLFSRGRGCRRWRLLLVGMEGSPELRGAPLFSAGPNLKEWLREQFCDHPLEHCEDTRLHDAAYVGDLQTLRSLLQEESYRRWACRSGARSPGGSAVWLAGEEPDAVPFKRSGKKARGQHGQTPVEVARY